MRHLPELRGQVDDRSAEKSPTEQLVVMSRANGVDLAGRVAIGWWPIEIPLLPSQDYHQLWFTG